LPRAGAAAKIRTMHGRVTPLGWLLIASVAGVVVAGPFSEPLSVACGAVAALLGFAAVGEALGARPGAAHDGDDRWGVAARDRSRRDALRRLSSGRTWDRRAPDAPDEPPEAHWERERARRARG
jgi:hypothetical protein